MQVHFDHPARTLNCRAYHARMKFYNQLANKRMKAEEKQPAIQWHKSKTEVVQDKILGEMCVNELKKM